MDILNEYTKYTWHTYIQVTFKSKKNQVNRKVISDQFLILM